MTWVYIQSEPGLWTVGFYDPNGKWHADSDHSTPAAAAERVHYLNGGGPEAIPTHAENYGGLQL